MSKADRIKEFEAQAEGSVELARNTVQSILKWSEFISDSEYSTEDHAALLAALQALYLAVQPINERYLEGGSPALPCKTRRAA